MITDGGNTKKNSNEQIKDDALAYLNSLYDDEFRPMSIVRKSWAYHYDTIYFRSKKYDDATVMVYHNMVDEPEFVDDYFNLSLQEEAKDYFSKMADWIESDIVVKFQFGNQYRPSSISANAGFTDCLSSGEVFVRVDYFSNDILEGETRRRVAEEFAEKKIQGSVCFTATQKSINNLEAASLKELLNSFDLDIQRNAYYINRDGTIEEYKQQNYRTSTN